MKTTEIRKFLRTTLGVKTVRITSTGAKNPYFDAWIPCANKPGDHSPLRYSEEFPLDFRQLALIVVYGPDCEFVKHGNAGNVRPHSISMHEHEWNQLIANWQTLEAAKKLNKGQSFVSWDENKNQS